MPGARAGVTFGSKVKTTAAELPAVPVVVPGFEDCVMPSHGGSVAGSTAKKVGSKFASGDARFMGKLWALFVYVLPTAPNWRTGPKDNGEFNNVRVTWIDRFACPFC